MKLKSKVINVFMILFLVFFAFETIVFADQLSCDSWLEVKTDLQYLFNLLKIVVPLIVIGLSSYDFIKAITAKDDKDIKKAFHTLLKRLIYAIILFFLPVLLNLLLDIAGTNSSVCLE